MRLMPTLVSVIAALVLAGCTSQTVKTPSQPLPATTKPKASTPYARPSQDGAPWWDVDVSKIPDAVPRVHNGPYKANPYTVLGKTYYPMQSAVNYSAVGTASWYGTKFHGQATANGESYDLYGMTAAHKTLPLPSYVRVTNLDNHQSVILRVNDRGPFYSDRIIDLSFAAAKKLGFAESGTARVKVEGIDPARWLAENGQSQPQVLAAPVNVTPVVVGGAPVEHYTPPITQHAAAIAPTQLTQTLSTPSAGVFVQIGAFANPDAAQLLRDKLSTSYSEPVFVSSVVRNQQILHRVRFGPMASYASAEALQKRLYALNIGQPTVVTGDK